MNPNCPHDYSRSTTAHGQAPDTCPTCRSDALVAGGDTLRQFLTTEAGTHCDRRFPRRYRDARVDHLQVRAWVADYHRDPAAARSLYLSGPVGTGKTYQAYAALRAAVTNGQRPAVKWQAITVPDLFAALRPGGELDGRLDDVVGVDLLMLDDLGAAKSSEWTEEVVYRLIDRRYVDCRPTIFTSNVAPGDLRDAVSARVASRLAETATSVELIGQDRRRGAA